MTTATTTETITSHLNSTINNSCSSSNADEGINQRRKEDIEDEDNSRCSVSTPTATTSYQQQVNSFSANVTTTVAAPAAAVSTCDNEYLAMCSNLAQVCAATSSSSFNADDIQQCDNESTVGSSCSSKSSSNEIEESCLLGIDCNEKTTVGLVLKVLADTAIRLDGDG
jgi:hypothetical protein